MKKLWVFVVIFLAAGALITFIFSDARTGSVEESSSSAQVAQVSPLKDVKKFSAISPDELVSLVGKPEQTEDWTYKGLNQYPVTTYSYQEGGIEFQFVDNQLVRVNYNLSEDASDLTGFLVNYGLKESDLKLYKNTGVVKRYYTNDKAIHEVYLMLDGNKTSLFRVDYISGIFQ